MDEKQAITRLQRGDLGGLEVLVRLYQLQAVRAACLITGDRIQADDIVQSAFLRAAERIGQFDSSRPFGPWFLRSVVHDAIKGAKVQKRFVSLDAGEAEQEFTEKREIFRQGTLDLVDPAPLPEEMVEAWETRQAVWQALEQLPPRQRAAVVLRYYMGMGEEEMAEELRGPRGSVKWWLHAARQRLAHLLKPVHASDLPTPRLYPQPSDSEGKAGDQR